MEALKALNEEKQKHSKVASINHDEMELQDYLAPNELSTHEARFIFHLRSRMVDLKANFRGKHSDWLCPLCKCDEDSQQHLLVCPELNEEDELVINLPNYNDLFSDNLEDKSNISRILRKRFISRNISSKS